MRYLGVGVAGVVLAAAVGTATWAAAPAGKPAAAAETPKVEKAKADKVPVVEWDFREERDPKKAGWPTGKGDNDTFTIEGDFEFKLRLQDGKDIDQRVRQVNGRKSGTLVKGVEMTGAAESTDAAYAEAKKMLSSLGFDDKAVADLEAWHKKAAGGNFDNLDLKVENSYNRVFTLHLVNDGTSEQPWSVGLDVDWSRVCGCHG